MRGLVWFKKDLRLTDNPALYHACQQADEGVIAVYIIDCDMWKNHHVSHCQIEFILRGLAILQEDLQKIGIPLVIKNIPKTNKIPECIVEICHEHKIDTVFFNRELEINETRRDNAVINACKKQGIKCEESNDQLILPYENIRTKQGGYYKVFTAFKNEWLKVYSPNKLFPKPKLKNARAIKSSAVPNKIPEISSNIDPTLWIAGENTARKYLKKFVSKNLFLYDKQRDFPALDATSKLSPYLAVGMISVRECFQAALEANNFELYSGNKGALTWMSELIWRDFYRHILIAVPRVCMNKAYKIETEKLAWNYDKKLLTAWQQGKTGFPIVDAAMRQLKTIGWMHNRLRMIAAMFLSKNLFLDWRLGENYFAENLIDFDFASNNGGWQWSASTGTDAVPYFRIFNPITQAKRFDPEMKFIMQYCPEYGTSDYPKPIIDYAKSRRNVVESFKALAFSKR